MRMNILPCISISALAAGSETLSQAEADALIQRAQAHGLNVQSDLGVMP